LKVEIQALFNVSNSCLHNIKRPTQNKYKSLQNQKTKKTAKALIFTRLVYIPNRRITNFCVKGVLYVPHEQEDSNLSEMVTVWIFRTIN